jgi:hypothetical protein
MHPAGRRKFLARARQAVGNGLYIRVLGWALLPRVLRAMRTERFGNKPMLGAFVGSAPLRSHTECQVDGQIASLGTCCAGFMVAMRFAAQTCERIVFMIGALLE